jgi:hypothetical protein
MTEPHSVIDWLLASDPAIRWQVMRDLMDMPASAWSAERANVETSGWGAGLLACQDDDGQWAGGAFLPADFDIQEWRDKGQAWTATCFSLQQLREFGLDPASHSARRTVALIGDNCRWDEGAQPYWQGEVEECINGRTVADGAYFGIDVSPIVRRLLGERQPDGGWNCERANGSTRSSFHTTINVLEGFLEYEKATGGSAELTEARQTGEAYLLDRALFRRLSTGRPADGQYLQMLYPTRWRYDVLRALDYFRASALLRKEPPDARLREAIEHLRSRRLDDGTWPLDWSLKGRVWFDLEDGPGHPSRWITLRALRVLKWWGAASPGETAPPSASRRAIRRAP